MMPEEADMQAKVLVVDDDPDILEALTMILESQGYHVSTARDGIEGLAKSGLKDNCFGRQ